MREHVNVARDLYNEPKQSGCGEMGGWGGGSVIFPKVKKKKKKKNLNQEPTPGPINQVYKELFWFP